MFPTDPEEPVPDLDPMAAQRWLVQARVQSPWLHEEIAQRMFERLPWLRKRPESWIDWEPLNGGLQGHQRLRQHLPQAHWQVWLANARNLECLGLGAAAPRRRWLSNFSPKPKAVVATAQSRCEMLWANMVLHQMARPQALLRQWHDHLQPEGFLMFSCLGPDSLAELRAVYQHMGWPAPAHAFTDMHDWGDMLVKLGFDQPVMDTQRLQLTYSSAKALLDELRALGRNLSQSRFASLRGRAWREQLEQAISAHGARSEDGRLRLSFEIIFGHAFKGSPAPAAKQAHTVSLAQMRSMLKHGRGPAQG